MLWPRVHLRGEGQTDLKGGWDDEGSAERAGGREAIMVRLLLDLGWGGPEEERRAHSCFSVHRFNIIIGRFAAAASEAENVIGILPSIQGQQLGLAGQKHSCCTHRRWQRRPGREWAQRQWRFHPEVVAVEHWNPTSRASAALRKSNFRRCRKSSSSLQKETFLTFRIRRMRNRG